MLQGFKDRVAIPVFAAGVALAAAQTVQAATVTGEFDGIAWSAQSTIVGQTSTGTIISGGDPIYLPDPARHNGVVTLIMNYGSAGSFICSGSLMNDRRSIVTAGHCVSSGGGVKDAALVSTTAFFYDFSTGDPDEVPALGPAGAVAIEIADYNVHADYTGNIIDQNDIAVLRLSEAAPAFAQSYGLYAEGDLTGKEFNVAGYGSRSSVGGDLGADLGVGRLRQGDNRYDFRLGDEDFPVGIWEAILDGFHGELEYTYISDFDNGLAGNDASCLIAGDVDLGGLGGPKYCDTGRGATEVGLAGGDSGGPGFIDGKLASVNSFGLTFGPSYGDVDGSDAVPILNSSFGELAGYVPIFIHEKFIRGAMVPEPATWALMIGGFALTGAALRRRRPVTVKA